MSTAIVLAVSACATPQSQKISDTGNPDDLLIIDCLLPGQVRQLGSKMQFLSTRRPIKTSAARCEIAGGEYVAFDRANAATSLRIWLPKAENADPQAQTYVGEIYEKGLGVPADYNQAAHWYQQAASQNYARAQINLGYLYETGLGVEQSLPTAMNLYRQASGIEDGKLEYVSTLDFAKRESAKRNAIELQSQVKDLSVQLAESETKFKTLRDQVRNDEATLAALKEQTEAKRQEIANNYSSSQSSSAPETAQALIDIDAVRKNLDTEQSKNNDLAKQLQASRDEIATLKTTLVADNQQIEQLKIQLTNQVSAIASLESDASLTSEQSAIKQTEQSTTIIAPSTSASQNENRDALVTAQTNVESTQQSINELRQRNNDAPDSLLKALGEAEKRELILVNSLQKRTESLDSLQDQLAELESDYQNSIEKLQSNLELSEAVQTRVALRLVDSEKSIQMVKSENQLLQDRLNEQNAEVAERQQEQQNLTTQLTKLELSEKTTKAQMKAAKASTKVANAELALARFEQSRLVTKLVEAQLNSVDSSEQLAILEKQLANQQGVVSNRHLQVSALETSVTQAQAQTETIAAEDITQIVEVGPIIEIIEPPVLITRGPGTIVASGDGTVDLVGRVSPADNLISFAINGQRQALNAAGVFNYQSSQVLDRIELTAVDDAGQRTNVNFVVTQRNDNVASTVTERPSTIAVNQYGDIDFGRYHAIVIGNNRYDQLTDLRTAEADARKIDSLLRNQYGFTTQLLINANKLDILKALDNAKQTLKEEDNLIVYYAGHGQIDPNGERGFWLPVDADVDDTKQWISNAVVTDFLDNISAKQIMVVADSCFSGTLTKASIPRQQNAMPAALRKQWLTLMAKRKVRTVLSSGGVKPVYDGTAEHSLFANAFIEQLSRNQGVLEGHRLYADIRETVQQSAIALGVDQVPQYAAVKYAGHEVGEFLFVSQ